MRKLFTLLVVGLAFVVLQASAQERTISGRVTSIKDNSTVPGVSVVVVGTTIGTSTDAEGKYSLNVPSSAKTLIFSALGMKNKEVTLGASNVIDVALEEDVLKLDEVVVTALGIKQEKKAVGYAVQDVGGDALTKAGSRDLINGLSAKVSGLTVINSTGSPGGASYIRLRGFNSITGDNQPLFVIDGVPIDNSNLGSGNPDNGSNNFLESVSNSNRALDINPDDIESVTVLKGAAASALYGINAAGGAIVITTKKGGKAGPGKSVNVTFNSSIQWDQVNKLPEMQNKYVQGTGGEWYGPETGMPVSWGPMADTMSWDGSAYAWDKHGMLVSSNDPTAKEKFIPYDNLDFFQTGVTYDNSVAIAGGDDKNGFRVSLGHLKQNGVIPLSDWSRTSLKFSGSSKISEKFSASGSVDFSNSGGQRVQQGSNLSGLMLGLLRTPISFDNSNGLSDPSNPNTYSFPDGSQRNFRGGGGYDNPYWSINKNPFHDDVNRVFGYASVNYIFNEHVDVTYRLGTDFYSDRRKQAFDIGSRAFPAGQVSEEQYFYRHVNSDLLFNFKWKFSEKIGSNFLLGNNLYSRTFQQVYAQGDGLNFSGFYNMNNTMTVLSRESTTRYRTGAVFGDWKLDFASQIYLELTGRVEKSSTLPTDDNVFFYPSASVGWVFTETFGMSDNKVLPFGKLRANYAKVGHDAPPYSLRDVFVGAIPADGWTNGISFPFNGTGGYTVSDVAANASLKPEKTSSYELGTELRWLNNRIALDVSYYYSKSTDQIIPVPVPGTTGFASAYLNAGEIENKGVEAILNVTPVKTKNFSWDLTLNWSTNKSKVLSLSPGIETIGLGGFEGSDIRAIAGQPYGVIYGGGWLRNSAGQIIIDDDPTSFYYGFPLADPVLKVLGDPNPDWIGGISNTFTYKSWSLTGVIDIRQGGDIWNGTKGALVYFGMSKLTENRGTTKVFQGVKASDGAPNDIVATLTEDWYEDNGGGFGSVAEDFIEDGSYVRLRQLALTYSVNPKYLKRSPFSSIDISFVGTNLWLSTDYTGVDPETSLTGANNSLGMDYFNNPGTKSYGVKVRVTL